MFKPTITEMQDTACGDCYDIYLIQGHYTKVALYWSICAERTCGHSARTSVLTCPCQRSCPLTKYIILFKLLSWSEDRLGGGRLGVGGGGMGFGRWEVRINEKLFYEIL